MKWFIYDLILRNPTASLCLLAIVVIGCIGTNCLLVYKQQG